MKLERPAGVPQNFEPIVDEYGVVTGWAAPGTVPLEIPSSEFNFSHGNLGRVKRIVARRKLKERIAFYELVLKTHQPLIKAMQTTQQAFQNGMQEGFKKGIQEAAKVEEEKS